MATRGRPNVELVASTEERPALKRPAKRQDAVVKREMFDAHIRDRYRVPYVIDDRNQVVNMWLSPGLTVLQVADGDF